MQAFFLLAIVGLIFSAAAHFSTFLGINPQESTPYIWILHIGIFVVFLPAIAIQGSLPRDANGKVKPFAFAPKWMQRLTGAAFIYALLNFAIFIYLMHAGSPYSENGQYFLKQGKSSHPITATEYHLYRVYELRGFSGHWMLFYSAAMTMIASGMAYRKTAGNTGLSLTGSRVQTSGPPLWVHTMFAVILQMVGFFFGPAIFITALIGFGWKPGCCGSVFWLLTPWPGLAFALYLLQHKLPGTCPQCGGRAFYLGRRQSPHHKCADCGWTGG